MKKTPKRTPVHSSFPKAVAPAEVTRRETDPNKNRHARDLIRRESAIVFATDPHGLSVAELHTDSRFCTIPLKTLQEWCTEDKWVERRAEVFDNWRKQVEDRLGSEMAKARIAEIREWHRVRAVATKLLDPSNPDWAPPKSWEGVARSLLEVNQRLEELAISVSREMLPGQPGGAYGADHAMRSELSLEEVRAATREVLRIRREAIRSGAIQIPAKTSDESRVPIEESEA